MDQHYSKIDYQLVAVEKTGSGGTPTTLTFQGFDDLVPVKLHVSELKWLD